MKPEERLLFLFPICKLRPIDEPRTRGCLMFTSCSILIYGRIRRGQPVERFLLMVIYRIAVSFTAKVTEVVV